MKYPIRSGNAPTILSLFGKYMNNPIDRIKAGIINQNHNRTRLFLKLSSKFIQ